jgi:glycosyltransferase 2 family protein
MTKTQRKYVSLAFGVLVSGLVMWALFRNIEFAELWLALQGANYWLLIPNVTLVVFAMYQRAYRWKYMVEPIKQVPYSKLLAATCIGFMANNVLPLRLGEFVRAYSLSYQDRDVSKSSSLGMIFVERMVFDLAALLLIFGAVIAVASVNITAEIRTGVFMATAIAMVGLVFVMVMAKTPERSSQLLTRYLFFLPRRYRDLLRDIILRFSDGLKFVLKPRTFWAVAVHTLLIWLVMGISNYSVFLAFGFDVPIDASYFLLVVVSISILVPSTPGFIGVYHAGTVFTLAQYGIYGEKALSFALVLHAAQYIPVTLMGFYFLKKAHLSLKKLEEEATEVVA